MDQKAAGPDPELVNSVLSARDARWEKRLALAEEAPSLVSLTLCVPLPLRTSPEGKALLRAAAEKLEEKLKLAGFQPAEAEYMDGADALSAVPSWGFRQGAAFCAAGRRPNVFPGSDTARRRS